jgi:hypothetical protein
LIPLEGPDWATREETGSEWEPIKIQLKNSTYEPNITLRSYTLTCQIHVVTGVLLDLGTSLKHATFERCSGKQLEHHHWGINRSGQFYNPVRPVLPDLASLLPEETS